jgi:metal-dependent hydrolase (beta-lactamase superfamily II)
VGKNGEYHPIVPLKVGKLTQIHRISALFWFGTGVVIYLLADETAELADSMKTEQYLTTKQDGVVLLTGCRSKGPGLTTLRISKNG